MLTPPLYLNSYREFAKTLDIPFYTSSISRRRQEDYLRNFYVFEREGQGYLITAQLKPYVPPPKSSKNTQAQTMADISTQLLHAIAEKKAEGMSTPSARGLANEVILTLASAYERVGLAIPGWTKLKEGNLDFAASSVQQRKAYFEHHDVCFSKWKRAVSALEEANLIKRVPWYTIIETVNFLEEAGGRSRLATEAEYPDCVAIDNASLATLNKRYPHIKFNRRSDVWLRFKEEEYHEIRREEIKKANTKHDNTLYQTTWIDTLSVSRFIFTPQMEQQWKKYLKDPGDIKQLKTQLTLKMVDWYKLPWNDGKYENVKLCLAYILGVEDQ